MKKNLQKAPGPPLWWDRLGWRVAITGLATWLVAVTIDHSALRSNLVDASTLKIGHRLREGLGLAAKISPHLKIFAVDDAAVHALGAESLSFADWNQILLNLEGRKVRSLMIADNFGMANDDSVAKFVDSANASTFPIVGQALVLPSAVTGREALALDDPAYDLVQMMNPAGQTVRKSLAVINWMPVESGMAYGPHTDVADVFTDLGHSQYAGTGHFRPFVRLGKTLGIRHFALAGATAVDFQREMLVVNGHGIPLDNDLIPINFPSIAELAEHSHSVLDLLAKDATGVQGIGEGDVVLILPRMFAGGVSYLDTPLGDWPIGYVHAAVINSVLTGDWFVSVNRRPLFHLLAVILGCAVGLLLSRRTYFFALFGGTFVIAALGMAIVAVFARQAPWLVPAFTFWLSGTVVYLERWRRKISAQIRIERELQTAQFVQASFVPERKAELRHLTIVGEYMPASECSGDWWGHFSLGPGRELLVIGDALGHGVPAALVTSMAFSCCQTLVLEARRRPDSDISPADILGDFNRILYSAVHGEYSMTLVVAEFNFNTGQFRYANAGHQFPVLLPKNPNDFRIGRKIKAYQKVSEQTPIWLQNTGPIVGLGRDASYENSVIPIQPGDKFCFFTDGVVEAKDSFGNSWGARTLVKKLLRLSHLDADEIAAKILNLAVHHLEGRALEDDLTLVISEVAENWEPSWEKAS